MISKQKTSEVKSNVNGGPARCHKNDYVEEVDVHVRDLEEAAAQSERDSSCGPPLQLHHSVPFLLFALEPAGGNV
jgi:hypothetical protein